MEYKSIFKEEEAMENVTPAPKSFGKQPMGKTGMTCEMIAGKFFSLYIKAQFFHWQTIGYAKHQMLGGVYDSIDDSKDTVMEYLLGVQAPKRLSSAPKVDAIPEYSDAAVTAFLDEGFQFTLALIEYGEQRNLEELVNLASDLQGVFAKAKYLNTLS